MNRLNKKLIRAVVQDQKGSGGNTQTLIRLAQQNRVLYEFSRVCRISSVQQEGKAWIEKLESTLLEVEHILENIEHIITRTYKYIPYVTFDVDLFVKSSDYEKVIERFRKEGYTIASHDNSLGGRIQNQQKNILKDELLTIDLHRDFTWQKRRFLDRTLLFKDTRQKNIAGAHVEIPSAEVEFLLCLADVGHERFNFTLLDLVWLEGLGREIRNWDLIFDQAEKYGWHATLVYLCKLCNNLSLNVYNKKIVPDVESLLGEINLPFFIPIHICLLSYYENVKKNKIFPFTSLAYMFYSRLRFYLSGKKRMPYYSDWFNLSK